MPSGFETELKVTGAPSAISALRRSFVVRALATGNETRENLRITYVDTPDGALARAGVSLRFRRKDNGLIQTVQNVRRAAFQQQEIETVLSAQEVFPALTGNQALDAKLQAVKHNLTVETTIHTDRRTLILRKGKTTIKAAFDTCLVEGAASGSRGFAEAKFDLVKGDPLALIALARLCLEEAAALQPHEAPPALMLSTMSKHARACALLGLPLPPAPNRVVIDPNASAGAALSAALELCVSAVFSAAPLICEARAPEGIKRLRIALRRFRSVERLFRRAACDPALRRLAEQARDFARVLGVARDWDVFVDETLPAMAKRDGAPAGLKELKAASESLRMVAWNDVVEVVSSAAFSQFSLDLMASMMAPRTTKALRRPVRRFAVAALDKSLAKARVVGRTLDNDAPSAGHPLRIALKKMRYAAQIFRDLYPREARKPYMAAMSHLQDGFGALNDAVVAQTLANQAARGQGIDAARAAGFVCGYRAAEARDAARLIGESWAAFESYPPFWRYE